MQLASAMCFDGMQTLLTCVKPAWCTHKQILESTCHKTQPRPDDPAFLGGGDGALILDNELCFILGDLNCEC